MATTSNEYVLGEKCYLCYDVNIYSAGILLWVTSDETKKCDMTEELRGVINYFNRMYSENGAKVTADTPPKLNGSILEILCAKQDYGKANVLVTIDLETGEVLSAEVLKTL